MAANLWRADLVCGDAASLIEHAVGQRTREIGIRLALGAKRGEVLRMVMAQAGRLAVTGVVIGLAAGALLSLLTARLLSGLLFGVSAVSVAPYLIVVDADRSGRRLAGQLGRIARNGVIDKGRARRAATV